MFAVLVFLAALAPAWAEPAGKEPYLSVSAEYFFNTGYRNLAGHKALAVGSYGGYGYGYGYRTEKEARQGALNYCRQWHKRFFSKEAKSLACLIYASGKKVVKPELMVGPALGETLTGPDRPLDTGMSLGFIGAKRNGLVIFVHGCDGVLSSYIGSFFANFFAAAGFSYYEPNSFADSRPSAVCGLPDRTILMEDRAVDSTRITKLRVAQTLRTINILKKRYPTVPIYLWGQSEGGYVVQFLKADVAGIIVSGEECGIDGTVIAAPAQTRVLFMYGSNDPFIDGFRKPVSKKEMRRCLKLVRNKNSKAVVIDNAGHSLGPWRPQIAKALIDFMGGDRSPLLSGAPPNSIVLDSAQNEAFKAYGKSSAHRAFSAGPNGMYSWVKDWEYAEDAKYFSLYDCARQASGFVFSRETQPCAVIDVDGRKPDP